MKHLNSINEHKKLITQREYFNDKINWKLYNHIVDMFTKYVDEGYQIELFMGVPAFHPPGIIYNFYEARISEYEVWMFNTGVLDVLQRTIKQGKTECKLVYTLRYRGDNETLTQEKLIEVAKKTASIFKGVKVSGYGKGYVKFSHEFILDESKIPTKFKYE